jgi:hypothetical protein
MSKSRSVLNPMLFCALVKRYGKVQVRNAGLRRVTRPSSDLQDEVVVQFGEEYLVPCRCCRDPGLSLSFSYMYGQPDDSDRPMDYLADCHKSNCLARGRRRECIADNLMIDRLAQAEVGIGALGNRDDQFDLPDWSYLLYQLPEDHAARDLIRWNGTDPDLVGRNYQVRYCDWADDGVSTDSILIPIHAQTELRGWLALSLYEQNGARYLPAPGMKTSELIYNIDNAKRYGTVVVVWEPLEVWAFGPMAVCCPGGWISNSQRKGLVSVCRKRDVVVLMTAEKLRRSGIRDLVQTLYLYPGQKKLVVEMPRHIPYSDSRSILRAHVIKCAREQGVALNFGKIA